MKTSLASVADVARAISIYLDSADLKSVLENNGNPHVAGITTNPSLMKKAGITDYKGFAHQVLAQVKTKPISFEVFSDTLDEMQREALEIKTWGSNVFVKIPIQTTTGQSTIPLVAELSAAGVNLNVTALFTLDQVKATVQAASPKARTLVSVFAGRIADTGSDPIPLMTECAQICRKAGRHTELLWASTREVINVVQAIETGCHIITIPPDVWKKLQDQWGRTPAELSLDTVKAFRKDSVAAGFKL